MKPVDHKLAIVILAAGCSSRLGQPKQFVEIKGQPLISRQVALALKMTPYVTTVVGYQADKCRAILSQYPVAIVENDEWQQGLSSSIACGVQSNVMMDAIMLILVDQWLVSLTDITRLIELSRQHRNSIVASHFVDKDSKNKAVGPPVIFPSRFFNQLTQLSGGQGAKSIISEHEAETIFCELNSAAIDLDIPQDLAMLNQYNNS